MAYPKASDWIKILILNQSGILQSRFYLGCPWYLCYPLVREGSPPLRQSSPFDIYLLKWTSISRFPAANHAMEQNFRRQEYWYKSKCRILRLNACNRITILIITLSFQTVSMVNLSQCHGYFTLSNAMNKFFVHFYVLSSQGMATDV